MQNVSLLTKLCVPLHLFLKEKFSTIQGIEATFSEEMLPYLQSV